MAGCRETLTFGDHILLCGGTAEPHPLHVCSAAMGGQRYLIVWVATTEPDTPTVALKRPAPDRPPTVPSSDVPW